MTDKTDIELLSEASGVDIKLIQTSINCKEPSFSGHVLRSLTALSPSVALAALALKEKQMQEEIDRLEDLAEDKSILLDACTTANEYHISEIVRLKEQLSDLSDEYELNLCKKCLHPKAMLCPGEYQCVNTECK